MRPTLLAVLMWVAVPEQGQAAELAAADKDAIRELLVRQYLKDWRDPPLAFLVFDQDTDPPDAFLKRFADLRVRIRKGSKAKLVDSKNSSSQVVFERDTGEPGVLITVQGWRLIEGGRVEVSCGVMKGRLWGFGGTFLVERVKGGWRVVEEISHWDS
jgi:hypothetical protein